MKTNITQYSDSELSLLVNNEEGLYNTYMSAVRRQRFSIIEETINECFIYTPAQLEELKDDFNAEVEEYFKEEEETPAPAKVKTRSIYQSSKDVIKNECRNLEYLNGHDKPLRRQTLNDLLDSLCRQIDFSAMKETISTKQANHYKAMLTNYTIQRHDK